jgi:hypothetical protein
VPCPKLSGSLTFELLMAFWKALNCTLPGTYDPVASTGWVQLVTPGWSPALSRVRSTRFLIDGDVVHWPLLPSTLAPNAA